MDTKKDMNIYYEKPWLKQYDSHVPANLKYPDQSLVDQFNNSCKKNPQNICFIYQEMKLTYKEVEILTTLIASGLINMGIQPRDHIGLLVPNIPEFGLAYFGILKAGAVVVAINPQYRPREIAEMIAGGRVKFLFSIHEKLEDLRIIKNEYPVDLVIDIEPEERDELIQAVHHKHIKNNLKNNNVIRFIDLIHIGGVPARLPQVLPEDPAVLQFTGGTTGTPKAAIGLHRNLSANSLQFVTWCNLQPGKETILAVIPLYHIYGMVLTLCLGMFLGASIVFWDNPKLLGQMLQIIEKSQVTFFPAVPSLYSAINQEIRSSKVIPSFKSLKACISGSAPLHPNIKRNFEALTGARLMEGYGLSEAPTATHCNPLYGENRTGSIGLPLPDVECRVVEIEDETKNVGIGEIGELLIKGPQVMHAYYKNDEETALALKGGWLHTGDIVRMDADGYFYIVDRKKSMIKVSGFQVWPNEIEQVLSSHPAIKEAGVGGITDDLLGERVIAWVVLKEGFQVESSALLDWCRYNLAAYKVPSEIIFIDALPRTSVGKILRRELIRKYIENRK